MPRRGANYHENCYFLTKKNGKKEVESLIVKKIQKFIRSLVLMMLATIIFVILPGFVQAAHAAVLTSTQAVFTSVELKINGNVVDANTPLGEPIAQNSTVSLFYTWEIYDSATVNAGDYIETTVPSGFLMANDSSGNLLLLDGSSLGTWSLTATTRKLRLTFNDYPTQLLNVHGTVQLNTSFELSAVSTTDPVVFTFPLSGGASTTINVKFSPSGVSSPVAKSGVANKAVNPDSITWTVDVNKPLNNVDNAVVNDVTGSGLSFDPNSLHMYSLDVALDGTVTQGVDITTSCAITMTTTPSALQFNLGNITDARRIVYNTTIVDKTKTSFTNTASFNGASAPASVNVTRGPLLGKSGVPDKSFNPTNITWTVYANKAEENLTDAVVKDTLPTGLSLSSSDVTIYELTLNPDGSVASTNLASTTSGAITVSGNSLIVDLGTIQNAYKIVYTTPIVNDPANYQFANTANLYDGTTQLTSANCTVSYQ